MILDHIFIDAKAEKLRLTELAIIRTSRRGSIISSQSEVFGSHVPNDRIIESVELAAANATVSVPAAKLVVIGHGLGWRETLNREWERVGRKPFLGRHCWIDVSDMAWPLVYAGIVQTRDLQALVNHFEIDVATLGPSAENAVAVMQVYWEMMRRYRTALHIEETGAVLAGKQFDQFRRIVGI